MTLLYNPIPRSQTRLSDFQSVRADLKSRRVARREECPTHAEEKHSHTTSRMAVYYKENRPPVER